ncbi:MAG: prephenate dehydrogenase [Bryobacteraceae bacterium]
MPSGNIRTVAIVGTGLIGCSFALAIKQAGFAGELFGISSPAAIDAALRAGAISRAASLEEAASRADLIYLAQPVDRILATLRALGSLVRPDCLITDAGSTKAEIVRTAGESRSSSVFLGGHPLAGKEQRGAEAANASLFRGRPYVLTPASPVHPPHFAEFLNWLKRIGARIVEMTPAEHDAAVAFTSHLPQILSTALAETLQRQENPELRRVFGPGLLDMTRLALGGAGLWTSILASNRECVVAALDAFLDSLQEVRDAIQKGDIAPFFHSAAQFAAVIRKLDHETRA